MEAVIELPNLFPPHIPEFYKRVRRLRLNALLAKREIRSKIKNEDLEKE